MKTPLLNIQEGEEVDALKTDTLVNLRKAKRAFDEINGLIENNAYSFQPEYQERNGARATVLGKEYMVFSSYDYLGLIGHKAINKAAKEAIDEFGTGTGGVRMLTGTNKLHRELEFELARFKGKEGAITFTSGYMANIAIATTLIGKTGKVYADEKIHRSFIDALKLAGSDYVCFPHNDTVALESMLAEDRDIKRKFIVSEGVFSMDGDLCPLPELVRLKKKSGSFLIIDEAHSFGVLGASGRGIDEHYEIDVSEIDVVSGSLSKTIPANGGFVLANKEVIVFLQHECAPFIFSGSLCPPATKASITALKVIAEEAWRIGELKRKSMELRSIVRSNGFETSDGPSAVIPMVSGDYDSTFALYKYLEAFGILVCPVIFPAVPVNRSIIRLCASVYHTSEMYAFFDHVLKQYNAQRS